MPKPNEKQAVQNEGAGTDSDNVFGFPTGIKGFDDLLRDKLILPPSGNGLIILIKGRPGTGKTTLALQIAQGALKWKQIKKEQEIPMIGKNVEVYSYEQEPTDLINLCQKRFHCKAREIKNGVKPDSQHINIFPPDKKNKTDKSRPLDEIESPIYWARELIAKINDDPKNMRKLIIVDGLNVLRIDQRKIIEVQNIVTILREKTRVGILVFETDHELLGGVDFQADMVIELKGEEIEGPPRYFLNQISIVKSRFQPCVLGWHQYKIKNDEEMVVFPSIHYRTHKINLIGAKYNDSLKSLAELAGELKKKEEKQNTDLQNEKISFETRSNQIKTNIKVEQDKKQKRKLTKELNIIIKELNRIKDKPDNSILRYLIGNEGFRKGSCTVILGPRRTWKTQLTLDFLRAGSRVGKVGLLLSFLDNQGTIVDQRQRLCKCYCLQQYDNEYDEKTPSCFKNHKYKECYKNFYLFHFRPGCLAPGEFFHHLDERIQYSYDQGNPIDRFVFWDLTQLESRFPLLANDRMFLPGLIDFLKFSKYHKGKDEERQISSVFMGAANQHMAQVASAMADNVIFSWSDTYQGKNGFVFYIDRIEGDPGYKRLYFLEEQILDEEREKKPILEMEDFVHPVSKENDLPYAESMIEEIRNLQGLPAEKKKRNENDTDERAESKMETTTKETSSSPKESV